MHLVTSVSVFLRISLKRKPQCCEVLTYSDLVDEFEAVFPHRLLSSELHGDSGLRLGRLFRDGRRLLEGLGKRNSAGVFTRQVAHLTHLSGLGVYEGAELTHPLLKRKNTESYT